MLKTAKKANAGQTDRQTNQPTDRPTNIVTYRVALHATKNKAGYTDTRGINQSFNQ